ncbi:MAG: cell division protein SepF [Methanomicrobiales archaeon]
MGKGEEERNVDDYMTLEVPDDMEATNTALYVKIATVSDIKDCPRIKDEIYNGNLVVMDIAQLRADKVMYERVLKDMKEVAKDVNGDIIGLGEQKYIIITPAGVKISRDKLGGI